MDNPCIHIYSALSNSPLTLRDLDDIGLDRINEAKEKKKAALENFGIQSVLDLLETYPRRYIDRTNMITIADLEPGVPALVIVTVESSKLFTTRNGKPMVKVVVTDGQRKLSITFFNQKWREKELQPGMEVAVFGKPDLYNGALQMTNPVVDRVGDQTGRILPIYPQSEKSRITTKELGKWIEDALKKCGPRGIADPVPQSVIDKHEFVSRQIAFHDIHLPESNDHHIAARRRLAFDEVLRVQLMLVGRKAQWEREAAGFSHDTKGHLIDGFMKALPFPLTGAQKRTIKEIYKDLSSPRPMHRLLQGDVGSGKTLVAVATMLAAVQGGHQAAIMAPTEVLADQHAIGIRGLLDSLQVSDESQLFGARGLRIELLTNKVTGEQRKSILAGIADGSVDIAIGTHALIQDKVSFKSLGAVVVDEQHRFGVEQRSRLRDKAQESEHGLVPDVLVMTATPIPRTLAMTFYGDLDVSVIDELPPGRKPITTVHRYDAHRLRVFGFMKEEIAKGRQVYIVYPLINESEVLDFNNLMDGFEAITRAFPMPKYQVSMVHGKMKAEDKEFEMNRFIKGETQIMVATTVIEVGVNVPNASVMVIESAERFGLSQLHQLRGRVGRGERQSYCVLMRGDALSKEGRIRLETMERTNDGFEVAEVDLKLRGPGDLLGTKQSGLPDFKFADLVKDQDILELAKEYADELLEKDKELLLDEHASLKKVFEPYFAERSKYYFTS